MDQLHAMRVFVAVAEHLSFAGAARALHMSRPAVTRAVAALEDSLGVELLTRTTRQVTLSQVGARYLEDCRRILEAVAEADDDASGSTATPRGQLTLTAPVMFGRLHVAPVVHAFLAAAPEVNVRLLLLDRVVNLVEEGIDVGVRIGHLEDSTLVAVRIGEVTPLILASPGYLAVRGEPCAPEALAEHTLIAHLNHLRRLEWRLGGPQPRSVPVAPRLVLNDVHAAVMMASAGLGLIRAFSYQVAAELEAGTLVRVLQPWEPAPVPVHLIHPGGRRVPARTRAFLDHAAEALRERLNALPVATST